MGQAIDLLFSDFAPDRGGAPWAENPGYLVDATNVRFTPNGWRSTYIDASPATVTASVGATAIAAAGFAKFTTPRHYVGTASKIYESDDFGVTWNDNAGAAYTATDWDFALFGTSVIAVNGSDAPQSKTISAAVGTNFAALGGSPPTGARIARVRDSVVLGNFAGTDIAGLQWSSIGNEADWPTPGSTTALARQAGSVSLPGEYGMVTDIVGGEKFGVVFQERAITRMTYVGGDIVFTFDIFEKGQGTGYGHSAIYVGGYIYFLNQTGFYRTDGYSVQSLSLGKVEETFFARLLSHPRQPASIGNGVAYDPRTKSVCWGFIDGFSNALLLCYDIPLGQFKIVDFVGTLADGTLYSVSDGTSSNTASVLPHFIDTTQKLRQFSYRTSVPTILRTGFIELEPGAITDITSIEVLGAKIPANPAISVRSVSDATDIDILDTNYLQADKSTTSDLFRVRKSGRFHSFRYADGAQTASTLVRGLRVTYEIKSAR